MCGVLGFSQLLLCLSKLAFHSHVALLSRKFDEHSLIELALLKVARESSQRNSEDCLGNVEKWRVLFSPEVNAFVVLESEQLFGIL